MSPRQLALDLGHRPALGRDDFIVSSANAEAVAVIDRWPGWPGPVMALTGPRGSGKSHLAAVWCHRSGAPVVAAGDLREADVPGLIARGGLALEDAGPEKVSETALFHAFNLARDEGAHILLTAETPPSAWQLDVPDLASRLRAVPSVALGAPDDLLLRAVLVKLFADRQLNVDVTVLNYICHRMQRSLSAAVDLVARLDEAALSQGRGITRALAGEVLERSD